MVSPFDTYGSLYLILEDTMKGLAFSLAVLFAATALPAFAQQSCKNGSCRIVRTISVSSPEVDVVVASRSSCRQARKVPSRTGFFSRFFSNRNRCSSRRSCR